ncbi:MAG: HAD-IIIC family phosphatase [Desulfomonilaceae bacterium]
MTDRITTDMQKQYWLNPSPLLMRKIWKTYYDDRAGLTERALRLAILSSFTVDNWGPYIEVQGALDGIPIEARTGSYGQFRQDIYDPDSWLVSLEPDVIIMAIEGDSLLGPAAYSVAALSLSETAEVFNVALQEILDMISSLVKMLPRSLVLVNNFIIPTTSTLGILENKISSGLPSQYGRANELLKTAVREISNAYVVDVDNLASSWGKRNFVDARMKFIADMPVAERFLPHLANLYGRYFRALRGKIRKCLVLDLDNTLWGGIIGEDGFDGIKLDPVKAPGSAFYAFQRRILDYYHRGVILAINSKNNLEDAMKVLESHPYMLLRPHHFAAISINWDDKTQNMKNLASELNIGLDSMVFLDDDPHQCGLMESIVPEVLTCLLPEDPSEYEGFLSSLEVFDTLAYSQEDSERGAMYAQDRLRKDSLKKDSAPGKNMEEFYRDLAIKCLIGRADDFTIPRIAQLTQRTNQFNLTTRRYSEGEIRTLAYSENTCVRWVSLQDKFGDLGLVGVIIIVEKDSGDWELDSLLMSCRALGRQVEIVLLHNVLMELFQKGARKITGIYLPTQKNSQVESFYEDVGFVSVSQGHYVLNSIDDLKQPPTWIVVQSEVTETEV